MMYIEHSPSEESLLNKLKRVPTQAAASVYLVNEHEAQPSAFSLKHKLLDNNLNGNPEVYTNGHINGDYSKKRKEQNVNVPTEFLRLPRFDNAASKLLSLCENNKYQYLFAKEGEQAEEEGEGVVKQNYNNNINQIQLVRNTKPSHFPHQIEETKQLEAQFEEEVEEEEEEDVQSYTLIDINESDVDDKEEGRYFESKHSLATVKKPLKKRHIELNGFGNLTDFKPKNTPDTIYKLLKFDSTCDESEFEYQVIGQTTENQESRYRKPHLSLRRPNLPLDKCSKSARKNTKIYSTIQKRRINERSIRRSLQDYNRRTRKSPRASYYDLKEFCSSDSEHPDDLFEQAVSSALRAAAKTIYKNGKRESQMGLNIFSKIREFFSFKKNENNNLQEELPKRKRRLTEQSTEEETHPQIKYRRVENNFPKYVENTSEDDLMTTSYSRKSQLATNKRMTDQKIKLRKSLFVQPKITRKIVKNSVYADIEFSDDDEIVDVTRPRNKSTNLVKNITFKRPQGVVTVLKHTAPTKSTTPASTQTSDMGGTFSSSLLPSLTYADVARNSMIANNVNGATNRSSHMNKSKYETAVLGATLPKSNALDIPSMAKTYQNEAAGGVLGGFKINTMYRQSVLQKQQQNEDHKNYLQLLKEILPRSYGNENASPEVRQQQPRLLVTDATGAKPKSALTNDLGGAISPRVRQPLCSTINLLDDDDDVEFTGVLASSSMRPSTSINHLKKPDESSKKAAPTILIDDDDYDDEVSIVNDLSGTKSAHGKSHESTKNITNSQRTLVTPVNTLFDRIHSAAAALSDSWIDEIKSKYLNKRLSRNVEFKEAEQLTSKLEAERQNAEWELNQRLKEFQIFDPDCVVVDDFPESDEEDEPKLVPLTSEHHVIIDRALHGPPNEVLVSKFNLNITRRDISTLVALNWLNDEVINFYMSMLTERSEKKSKSHGLPTVYAMNTFFMSRLMQSGHAGVKRWTRKVDIFSKDLLPVPVHVGGVHWCMAIINLKRCTIKYYDSMGTPNPTVLNALEQYLKDESLDKRKQPFDTSGFEIKSVESVPRQMNGSDCGVFSCMFAEFITRNCDITFSQQNMEYFRRKMILEIVQGELLQ